MSEQDWDKTPEFPPIAVERLEMQNKIDEQQQRLAALEQQLATVTAERDEQVRQHMRTVSNHVPLLQKLQAAEQQVRELTERLAGVERERPTAEFVWTDPQRRGGRPCLKGTRFTISQLIAEVAKDAEHVASVFGLDADTVVRFFIALSTEWDDEAASQKAGSEP